MVPEFTRHPGVGQRGEEAGRAVEVRHLYVGGAHAGRVVCVGTRPAGHALCGSDPARFRSMSGRFSRPVLPGESLTVSMWRQRGSDTAAFQTTREDGVVVIDRGLFQGG